MIRTLKDEIIHIDKQSIYIKDLREEIENEARYWDKKIQEALNEQRSTEIRNEITR